MSTHKFKILGEDVELDDDITKFTAAEIAAIERYTGFALGEFGRKLANTEDLSVLCWSALAWVCFRRAGHTMPYDVFMESVALIDLIVALSDGGVDVNAVIAGAQNAAAPKPNRAEKRHPAKKDADPNALPR